jgi:probable F420-dependent oxidoreductase
MKTAIGLFGLETWFGGDVRPTTEAVRIADSVGVDQVVMSDHVVMGPNPDKYPYGPKFPAPFDADWIEPMLHLAHIAAVTTHIRLAVGILITPLRPAPLMAKQIATLDYLSNGRAHIGMGWGWQKEEVESGGVKWADRFAYMVEQVRVCKKLWTEAPTSFHGRFYNFDDLTCFPHPVQKPLPIGFGVAPTDRNLPVIAELGDAWLPMETNPDKLAAPIRKVRDAFKARGRDPAELEVRASIVPVMGANGRADIPATLATVPRYADVGVTTLNFQPRFFARDLKEMATVYEQIVRGVKG